MKKISVLAILVCIVFGLHAQKVKSYVIDTHFFPEKATRNQFSVPNESFMRGSAEVELESTPLEGLHFYLHGELIVDSITSGEQNVAFKSELIKSDSDYSMIALKTRLENISQIKNNNLKIYYSGFFHPSKVSCTSNYMRINRKEGVFLRSTGYSLWFPCFLESWKEDYCMNFKEVRVTLPKGFRCVVTGRLEDEKEEGKHYIAKWKPGKVESFSVQCSAQKYQVKENENVAVYYTSDGEPSNQIIEFAEQLSSFYEHNFRKSDVKNKIYIVELPKYGDIASGNMIGLTKSLYEDFSKATHSKNTLAHELVHSYVQIPVDSEDQMAALIIEGFPSYFDSYAMHKIGGDQLMNLKKKMLRIQKSYLRKKRTGVEYWSKRKLPEEKAILDITSEEIGSYKDTFILNDRVSLFLYDLYQKMGDKKHEKFLKELFQMKKLNDTLFEALILKYLPDYKSDLEIWLKKIEYPERFHLK